MLKIFNILYFLLSFFFIIYISTQHHWFVSYFRSIFVQFSFKNLSVFLSLYPFTSFFSFVSILSFVLQSNLSFLQFSFHLLTSFSKFHSTFFILSFLFLLFPSQLLVFIYALLNFLFSGFVFLSLIVFLSQFTLAFLLRLSLTFFLL